MSGAGSIAGSFPAAFSLRGDGWTGTAPSIATLAAAQQAASTGCWQDGTLPAHIFGVSREPRPSAAQHRMYGTGSEEPRAAPTTHVNREGMLSC